jgi:F420-non-reducing hydrogenase iron-sulfur subunit
MRSHETGNRPTVNKTTSINKEEPVKAENFEPKIIAFICNWCAYGAADLAGVSRLQYPPNVRAVRVMCSATVSPHHILRALQDGADGVLVGG